MSEALNNQSETDMKNRLQEIKEEEEKLRKERHSYEEYFREKAEKHKIAERKSFEGKYFKITNVGTSYRNKDIKAFKVVHTYTDRPDYALCYVIMDNSKFESSPIAYGVMYKEIGLWLPWMMTLQHMENSMKVIDVYQEITEEEFKQIQSEVLSKIVV